MKNVVCGALMTLVPEGLVMIMMVMKMIMVTVMILIIMIMMMMAMTIRLYIKGVAVYMHVYLPTQK